MRLLKKHTTVVNLLGTAGVEKPAGCKGKSWIRYYQDHARTAPMVCCAEGCYRTDNLSGGHVKIANGPTAAALLHTKWYIVPECPAHNKRSSCKTFRVKQTVAVEASPSLVDRVSSWQADLRKLLRTLTGRR